MQKLRTTPMPKWIHALVLAGLFCSMSVVAQDTLPDKNGDLSDFRLDTPKPKDKAAEPTPKVEAPVKQPVAKTAPPPAKSVPRAAPQKPPADPPAQDTPASETKAAPSAEEFADISAPSDISDNTAPDVIAGVGVAAVTDYVLYWPWLATVLAAVLAIIVFWLWRRRRTPASESKPTIIETRAPTPPPIRVAKPVIATSNLTARFDPADARLSVANLTVKGHLHLRYDGEAPLEMLKLRTRIMSACDGQKALIDAFHSDPAAGQIESFDSIVPGEEIDLTLEMQVPRDALQAFDWRERRFVAPIVLINIASDDGGVTPCRISCVVGQEGALGATRLQPIPIDRGPKLFGTLQFRPIAA